MRNNHRYIIGALAVCATVVLWLSQADAQNQDIRRGGGGGGQPASQNLTNWSELSTNMLRTVTNNFSVYLQTANPTNVVDMGLASSTNILNASLTILYATNGVDGYERTHVRWLWAGGSDRTFAIPSQWKTNVFSPVPANITNGTITKMYITTVGNTSTLANQTNVFVSFEYYK